MNRRLSLFVFVLLVIEFMDEFMFGAGEAAIPLIRDDLGLTYTQIGLSLTLPQLLGNLIEPIIGILGDVWKRRVLVLGGGLLIALAAFLTATSHSFIMLMLAFILFNPSSGAFVGLAQATLMDTDHQRMEHNMARWTLAGSLGVVTGPLALSAFLLMGLGWRNLYFFFALLALAVVAFAARFQFPNSNGETEEEEALTFRDGVQNALAAVKRREVLRWLVLLQFSDLMLDILLAFLALYFVDVVRVDPETAALGVAVWSGLGLLGDLLLIPLLEYVPGLRYLKISAVIEMVLYIVFLLIPGFMPKVIIVGLLGFFNSGWYSILSGNLYASMPGQSGTVMAVGNVVGFFGSLIPLLLGFVAQEISLSFTMWLLLSGPIALLIGLPRHGLKLEEREEHNHDTDRAGNYQPSALDVF